MSLLKHTVCWSFLLLYTLSGCNFQASNTTAALNQTTPQLLRYPYLQSALGDSISVLWRTDRGRASALSYRQEGAVKWQTVQGQLLPKRVGGLENSVTVRGLQAGHKYEYKILTDGHELATDKHFFFTVPKLADASFSFYAAGDIGEPVHAQGKPDRMAATISSMKQMPDFGILLGDIIYPDGESEGYDKHLFNYFSPVFSKIPTFALLGNHEWHVDPEQNFIQEWKLPGNEHYYSFDWGNTHFIALDTKKGEFFDWERQKAWLEDDLRKAQEKGYMWLVVLLHYNGKSCTYKEDTPHVMALYPLFYRYGIDLVLNGHAHTYERLNPMQAEGEVLPEWLGKTSVYQDVKGFISITVGSGGKLRGIGSDPTPYQPNPQNCRHSNLVAFSMHDWAFLRISIDGHELKGEAISSLTGEVLDSFSLLKTKAQTEIGE